MHERSKDLHNDGGAEMHVGARDESHQPLPSSPSMHETDLQNSKNEGSSKLEIEKPQAQDDMDGESVTPTGGPEESDKDMDDTENNDAATKDPEDNNKNDAANEKESQSASGEVTAPSSPASPTAGAAGSRDETTKKATSMDQDPKEKDDSAMDIDEQKPAEVGNDETKTLTASAAAPAPPPPVMKGTLTFDRNGQQRRHVIRGIWNYENNTEYAPQKFELLRTLEPDEDEKKLPCDGEFHGSFNLTYVHRSSKGKLKERSKVIPETGVNITFRKQVGQEEYKMHGTGTNQFGVFHIEGIAKPFPDPTDHSMSIEFRKRYEPGPVLASSNNNGSRATGAEGDAQSGPLPEPSQSFATGVVCLRGNMFKEDSASVGVGEVIHRIGGFWAQSLDFVQSDPDGTNGLCNRFEYEHKSSSPSAHFPVSGKYSGWFDLSNEDGTKSRINERDVTLKFRKNNAGYYNVEGKGSNVFGKYTITGTLDAEKVLTIFRHFQPRKIKKSNTPLPAATPSSVASSAIARAPQGIPKDLKLKSEDVVIEGDDDTDMFEPIQPPAHGTYSAVSRGVLRINEDGSHSCSGKWAVSREHFTNGQTSNFTFRLEAHLATVSANDNSNEGRQFPLDSELYKGTFQLKKTGSRTQTIVDQQIVMKFRKNDQGSFNVHGKGVNAIGEFKLLGTLVTSGKTGGQVELYRLYPPAPVAAAAAATTETQDSSNPSTAQAKQNGSTGPQPGMLQRRESSRPVKLPSRLEDDDPDAQISRTLDKCAQLLKFIREKDRELGSFFSKPVDPFALGIPTYFQIVKEPMDLHTVQQRLDAEEIRTPEDFSRLVTLVFENAMTFNVDPNHSVHQAARSLLVLFNQRFRDVDRMVQSIRRTHGMEIEFDKGGNKASGKKRGRQDQRSAKQIRLEEAQAMAATNASAIASIIAAAPSTNSTSVSRSEFNMLLNLIKTMQDQVVRTHSLLAELSPGSANDVQASVTAPVATKQAKPQAKPSVPKETIEKKKGTKRKPPVSAPEPVEVALPDETIPLSHEEQELLTDTINGLAQEHLMGVIQIIREAAPVGADEDEIDLEIDQLDTRTQRKLLRHVSKKPKQKRKNPKPKNKEPTEKQPPSKKPKTTSAAKTEPSTKQESFLSFGGESGSESDADDEVENKPQSNKAGAASNNFSLGPSIAELEDENEDIGGENLAMTWNVPQPKESEEKNDDDDWADEARQAAAAVSARDADRKAREEKKKAEAEEASRRNLADAAARGEELKMERAKEEAREATLREQQEREAEEAKKAEKEKVRAALESMERTVDLGDAQRDIMKDYNFDNGGASPSSDFEF